MSTEKGTQPPQEDDLTSRFRDLLDLHGYGFQYAVIRKLDEIFSSEEKWVFEVAEFPTTTGRFDTRIDFIIRPRGTRFFLVAECKRANPARNDWCFVRSPYVRRGRQSEFLFIEEIVVEFADGSPDRPERVFSHGVEHNTAEPAYHIGLGVKNSQNKGDSSGGSGRQAIEEAAGQVCKGVNGLVMTLAEMSQDPWPGKTGREPRKRVTTRLMPAIFTTAKLWTSDADLGAADLLTGHMSSDFGTLRQVPWLYLQYPISPGLKHTVPTSRLGFEFSEMLDPHYMRTIAVISAHGIEQFIRGFHPYP